MSEIKKAEDELISIIENRLPNFARACKEKCTTRILLHQDSFARDYQIEEYYLLGAAIKYAGLMGKEEIIIIGKNRETLGSKLKAELGKSITITK